MFFLLLLCFCIWFVLHFRTKLMNRILVNDRKLETTQLSSFHSIVFSFYENLKTRKTKKKRSWTTTVSLTSRSCKFHNTPLLQAELIDPAVKGTLNVLASCAKVPTIKRVVITSSMAAVLCTPRPLTPETVVDETWFSVPEICEKLQMVCILAVTFWSYILVRDKRGDS